MSSLKTYKRIVFITSRFPYPLEKGDKLRAYFQLKELAKHFEVHLICLSEIVVDEASKEKVLPFVKTLKIFEIPAWRKWLGAGLELFGNRPIQVGYFHHRTIQKQVDRLLLELKPDHIYCQLIRVSEYVKNYHSCAKTIDYMDTLSKGIERRIESEGIFSKQIFKLEYRRLLRYENHIYDFFEHHTIISAQDRALIPHPNRNNIVVIRNGVDEQFFEPIETNSSYTLVFTGNMSYPPNIEAAKYIVQEILPLLDKSATILISGASPVKDVLDLGSGRVKISGWVDDIRESYASGKIFVAPMFIGTGLQNKLLEAMAAGTPCITTPLANNALGALEGKEILLANSPEEFAQNIRNLLAKPTLYEHFATNGRQFVKTNYVWKECTQKLITVLKS